MSFLKTRIRTLEFRIVPKVDNAAHDEEFQAGLDAIDALARALKRPFGEPPLMSQAAELSVLQGKPNREAQRILEGMG